MGLPEIARECKQRWQQFCETVRKPEYCIYCAGKAVSWRGSRLRTASVLVDDGERSEVVYHHDIANWRVKCAAAGCGRSWTLRPPGLFAAAALSTLRGGCGDEPVSVVEAQQLACGELTALVRQISNQTHYLPGKGPVGVKERTLYDWLQRYRNGGIAALRPKVRKDKGASRALSDQIIERAVALRKENTTRWTSTLIDILKRDGTLQGRPVAHRATFDRHLSRRGASRRLLRVLGAKRTIKMQFNTFGE